MYVACGIEALPFSHTRSVRSVGMALEMTLLVWNTSDNVMLLNFFN